MPIGKGFPIGECFEYADIHNFTSNLRYKSMTVLASIQMQDGKAVQSVRLHSQEYSAKLSRFPPSAESA